MPDTTVTSDNCYMIKLIQKLTQTPFIYACFTLIAFSILMVKRKMQPWITGQKHRMIHTCFDICNVLCAHQDIHIPNYIHHPISLLGCVQLPCIDIFLKKNNNNEKIKSINKFFFLNSIKYLTVSFTILKNLCQSS